MDCNSLLLAQLLLCKQHDDTRGWLLFHLESVDGSRKFCLTLTYGLATIIADNKTVYFPLPDVNSASVSTVKNPLCNLNHCRTHSHLRNTARKLLRCQWSLTESCLESFSTLTSKNISHSYPRPLFGCCWTSYSSQKKDLKNCWNVNYSAGRRKEWLFF